MDYTVVERQAFGLVGLKLEGSYDSLAKIPNLWATFTSQIDSIPHRIGNRRESYGVYQDLPTGFIYYAGVEASSIDLQSLDTNLEVVRIPTQTYAVFQHVGPIGELGKTMSQAQNVLQEKGVQIISTAYKIEAYDERYSPTSDASMMQIYYPIA